MEFHHVLFIVIIIGFITYFVNKGYKNTKDIALNRITIHPDDQPDSGIRLKILHLSDLHLENISITPEELYEKLKNEGVDLIALTGDFLDRKRTIPKLGPYLQALKKLNCTYGMYVVLGNHDYVLRKQSLTRLEAVFAEYDCKVLHNESIAINVEGRLVNIVGIDDHSTGRSNLDASYKKVKPGAILVLTHDPNVVLEMKDYHFDYLLAGHFHGGQICYPKAYHLAKMGPMPKLDMIKGLHKYDHKLFYISEGLGQTGVNIRVGSRPEITVHDFQVADYDAQSVASAI